eukprot:CAMPEP_0179940338 /NCGR_PEP_ID=MMETSP0983-20121128/16242_1 /TAXON_ID=483367 /ORGANISM="non described non described, Strain CCMP 2436" /LENGTH=308 /DNA_ID=CAMNT_0021846991 /DNA_START=288 /DNA_END=1217 /DNA_ORIENTATION=-
MVARIRHRVRPPGLLVKFPSSVPASGFWGAVLDHAAHFADGGPGTVHDALRHDDALLVAAPGRRGHVRPAALLELGLRVARLLVGLRGELEQALSQLIDLASALRGLDPLPDADGDCSSSSSSSSPSNDTVAGRLRPRLAHATTSSALRARTGSTGAVFAATLASLCFFHSSRYSSSSASSGEIAASPSPPVGSSPAPVRVCSRLPLRSAGISLASPSGSRASLAGTRAPEELLVFEVRDHLLRAAVHLAVLRVVRVELREGGLDDHRHQRLARLGAPKKAAGHRGALAGGVAASGVSLAPRPFLHLA